MAKSDATPAKKAATAAKTTAAKAAASKAAPAKAATKTAPAKAAASSKAAPATTAKAAPAKPATKAAPAKAAPPKPATKAAPAKAAPAKAAAKAAPTKAAPAKAAPTKAAASKTAPATKKATATTPSAPPTTTPKVTPVEKSTVKPAAKSTTASKTPPADPAASRGLKAEKDGIVATKDFDFAFLKAQRELLIENKASLTGQATRLEDEANSLIEEAEMGDVQFDDESGEGDTMVVERERDLALSAQARQMISEIDAALERLKIGSYGYSVVSGLPIARERLEAIPWATERVDEKVSWIGRR